MSKLLPPSQATQRLMIKPANPALSWGVWMRGSLSFVSASDSSELHSPQQSVTHLAFHVHLKSKPSDAKPGWSQRSLPKTHHLRMPPAVTHTSLSFLFAIEAKLPMARLAMSPEIDFNHISTKEMIFFFRLVTALPFRYSRLRFSEFSGTGRWMIIRCASAECWELSKASLPCRHNWILWAILGGPSVL